MQHAKKSMQIECSPAEPRRETQMFFSCAVIAAPMDLANSFILEKHHNYGNVSRIRSDPGMVNSDSGLVELVQPTVNSRKN